MSSTQWQTLAKQSFRDDQYCDLIDRNIVWLVEGSYCIYCERKIDVDLSWTMIVYCETFGCIRSCRGVGMHSERTERQTLFFICLD